MSEYESIVSMFLRYSFEAVVAGIIVFLLIKYFLPGYLSQKGKNLATKEDIEGITETIESVKAGYAEVLEGIKSNNQIKIAAIEREKALKKEVYMEAVEAITHSQNMISGFANLNVSEEQLSSSFSGNAGKIAKVQLVGEKETVRAVSLFMGEIGTAVLYLMLERNPLMLRKQHIQRLEGTRDKHQIEIDRYLSIINKLKLDSSTEQGIWQHVNQSLSFECTRRDELNDEIQSLLTIQSKEHLAFTRKCMDTYFTVSKLLPQTVLSVRRELELDIDESDYVEIFNSNLVKGKQVFEAFLSEIEVNVV
ncbi:chromosome partitioning protein ParA [Vibrio nomapromontoriensis]|uniref:chromosome partitioning protein ParA n=1 Tax=Vibrio nomapromontoriensis TaxID=2910246 RepID=UPI003D145B1F